MWFQNRRAKFRKQERLAQQKSSQSSGSSTVDTTSIKTEPKQCGQSKDGKPGTPSTPGSISSNNGSTDMKSVNGSGKRENICTFLTHLSTKKNFNRSAGSIILRRNKSDEKNFLLKKNTTVKIQRNHVYYTMLRTTLKTQTIAEYLL